MKEKYDDVKGQGTRRKENETTLVIMSDLVQVADIECGSLEDNNIYITTIRLHTNPFPVCDRWKGTGKLLANSAMGAAQSTRQVIIEGTDNVRVLYFAMS